jgi:DNA topoisomerase-1
MNLARDTHRLAKAVGLVRARRRKPLPTNPEESANAARCHYVDDSLPGIKRVKHGKGFSFVTPEGKPVRDADELRRIRGLVIPPAWTNVWICPDPDGHIQATGRDARGRKQYRYHWRFREVREETKYEHMLQFADALPAVRAKVDEDLGKPWLTRDKVLATVVRLLEITLIRVGNEEYARENGSFGLTTMRARHIDIEGSTIEFHFRGKSKKDHKVKVQDRRLARILQRCNDLPGEVLFQWVDEAGELHSVESSDVNEYLHRIAGSEFTAKDFRTWAGTVLAANALHALAQEPEHEVTKKSIALAVKTVSSRLGNTPSVCRKCYVHPEIFDAYMDGHLVAVLGQRADEELRKDLPALSSEEAAVLMLLRDRLAGKRPGLPPPSTPHEATPRRAA